MNDETERCEWFNLSGLPERTLDSKEDITKWRELAKSASAISRE